MELAPEEKGKLSNLVCRLDPLKQQKEITYLVNKAAELNPAFVKFASGLTASDLVEQLQENVDSLSSAQFSKIAQVLPSVETGDNASSS